jgi:divalent metal cation (Fe/Co/Zn/Cd) transporter
LLIVLCVFVVLSSIVGIVLRIEPEGSLVGIAVSALAVVAMPLLAWQKRRVNAVVGSPSLRADIAETISCAYLAGVTLAGLAATTLFGWWWAQYVAAIALLIWLVPEAREAFWAWRDNEPD